MIDRYVISLNSDWLFKAKIVRVYIDFITYVEAKYMKIAQRQEGRNRNTLL